MHFFNMFKSALSKISTYFFILFSTSTEHKNDFKICILYIHITFFTFKIWWQLIMCPNIIAYFFSIIQNLKDWLLLILIPSYFHYISSYVAPFFLILLSIFKTSKLKHIIVRLNKLFIRSKIWKDKFRTIPFLYKIILHSIYFL